MVSLRVLRLAGAAAGALVLAGAVIVVTAEAAGVQVAPFAASPTPKPSASPNPKTGARTATCDDFVNHFAADLGKKPSDVQAAAQKAFGQTIDDAVKAGQLTQQQGDALKQKYAAGQLCSGALNGIAKPAPPNGDRGPEAGVLHNLMADVAKALGISETDLMTQLQSGKSLKDIAAAQGLDEAAFRTKFLAAVKADLDQQVTAGKLTAQQEQMILAKLQTAPLPYWNGAPRPPKPKPTPTPSASTT